MKILPTLETIKWFFGLKLKPGQKKITIFDVAITVVLIGFATVATIVMVVFIFWLLLRQRNLI